MAMLKSILLVEDDPFLIDIYSQKFKKSGFEIRAAETADKAFEMIKEKIPDLILLDIVLPQIDGWSILKKMKADKALSEVKIIVFSNLGQKEEVEKGLNLGAVKYLIKAQYTPLEVVKEVSNLLGSRLQGQADKAKPELTDV
ncbi:MAG: response regulator [Candidatus Pacebacteria bacterium]|nr:response regulator [Candidatus Paceibacterota bacterium]